MLAVVLALTGAPAHAQDIWGVPVRCSGQIVSDVVVRTAPPGFEGIARRWKALARTAQALHTTTRGSVVRRFVILEPGRPCTELRRTESERILRAQPFIADAAVHAYPDGQGGVIIDVVTVDEVATLLNLDARGERPYLTSLRLGTTNLSGSGTLVQGEWRNGFFYRDTFGASVVDHQFLGRSYQLALSGVRRAHGGDWMLEASHPYLTDLQRIAWRTVAGERRGYIGFVRPGAPGPALFLHRSYADIGGIVRIGEPGRLSLFGASVSRELEETLGSAVIITDSGLVADTSSALVGRYGRHRSARINALWGVRNIHFMRVTSFDALTAAQDVRVGFQLGALAGRSLDVLGSRDDDIFLSADLYAGIGRPDALLALQVQGEGRQSYDSSSWDGVLTSGRLASYLRIATRHTFTASAEWSGGWRQRVPYQLALGDPEGGVRGYADSRAAGAQRAVLRFEDRWFIGRPRGAGDAGVAVFFDAGRVWAGDVPFGLSTPMRYGIGVGLLAAVPPRSKRMWRLDLAFPLSADPDARWELRFSNRDRTRAFWDEPEDVERSRERTVPTSIFTWP